MSGPQVLLVVLGRASSMRNLLESHFSEQMDKQRQGEECGREKVNT